MFGVFAHEEDIPLTPFLCARLPYHDSEEELMKLVRNGEKKEDEAALRALSWTSGFSFKPN